MRRELGRKRQAQHDTDQKTGYEVMSHLTHLQIEKLENTALIGITYFLNFYIKYTLSNRAYKAGLNYVKLYKIFILNNL